MFKLFKYIKNNNIMEDDYGQFTYLDYQQEARPRKNIEYVEIEGLQTSISIESLDDWFENTNSNIDEISKKINDLTKQKMFIFTRLALLFGLILFSGAWGLYAIFTL
tara:strand:- start:7199 stop:7519 length:321 start_codon:yes stop_codon:yes gene_type:complete